MGEDESRILVADQQVLFFTLPTPLKPSWSCTFTILCSSYLKECEQIKEFNNDSDMLDIHSYKNKEGQFSRKKYKGNNWE
jgi:hypothetical protein